MIAILNHMPFWAGVAVCASIVSGVLLAMLLVWLSGR